MAAVQSLFDPRSIEFHLDPYPTYARLRKLDPVHESPLGFVMLTRYDDCQAALRDNRFGRSGFEHLFKSEYAGEDDGERLPRSMLFSDPPDHTRLRSLVNKAFTTRVIDEMRGNVQSIVDGLIDQRIDGRGMDLIDDLAYPLPFTVICQMLGVPMKDLPDTRSWSESIARTMDALTQSDELIEKGRVARRQLVEYFRGLIAERRREPRDDLLSMLIAAEESGDKLSMGELLATCVLLFVSGHETTVNLIGNGMLALLHHPDQMQRLKDDPSLMSGALDEMLRYDAPIQRTVRLMSEDVEFAGRTLRKGRLMVLALAAANRDAEHFSDPERFDIQRAGNRHLAFGFGIHFCIGSMLARMEAQVAIGTLLRRLPTLHVAAEKLQWRPSFTLRGLKSLPVSW